MTQAPERIFADWVETFGAVEIGTWADTVRFSKQGTEYIRADLVPQWQPIETAPKDGGGVMLGVKINDKFRVFAPCEWSRAGEISEDGFWLWWQSEPEWLTEVRNPTHWMPLPAPPSP